ncbi:unnamed protein product [Rotaria magnacalcarata]|uniref:Trafficking protein particle complex subunit 2-like protein n=1 Tax=Rotaria magnacalcarata TaxID=392030 RepID=A0A815WJ50_9BILA|nr:unnamed protein product [Rotaria magnacalcarata]CAF1546589.1 unnamed protein product [Rotaria magnacalcarata]CAF1923228.1 unnamed protein product [Rotaria magnacalcarata]CAF2084329.1 unnamed protein product [Rotaria magnacalcarata]CAF2124222.1 unnamed protein product [Rotaria magnacalcarata]
MACCVAVLIKENLIYLRRSAEELKFLFLIHASIDILDDKVNQLTKPTSDRDARDFYLGLLYPVEEYKIYGYVSSTRVKFILIFEHSTSISLKDPDIKLLFQRLHQAYIDCISNPFYEPNTQLKSKRFEQVVTSLMVQNDPLTSAIASSQASSVPSTSVIVPTAI